MARITEPPFPPVRRLPAVSFVVIFATGGRSSVTGNSSADIASLPERLVRSASSEHRQDEVHLAQLQSPVYSGRGPLLERALDYSSLVERQSSSRISAVTSDNTPTNIAKGRDKQPVSSSPENADPSGEARNIIRGELATNLHLSSDRRSILQSALSLVTRYVNASQRTDPGSREPSREEDNCGPGQLPPELFYLMLNGKSIVPRHTVSAKPCPAVSRRSESWSIHWPDHISVATLRKMSLALLDGSVSGQTALQYTLCVVTKAAIYVSRWLRTCPHGALSVSLEKSQQRYISIGLGCMKQLDFVSRPNLLALQSLLSGAVLSQLVGDSTRAWILTGFAATVITGLGYHNWPEEMLGDDDVSSEVRHCIYWCYYLDKTLSSLLIRPPSLPGLRLNPAMLVPVGPSDPLALEVRILVKLAEIQDVSLSLLIGAKQRNETEISQIIRSLHDKLHGIWDEITQARPAWTGASELTIESDAVNFTYYTTFTTVLRLNSSLLQDHSIREDCLLYAREALIAMRSLQTQVSNSNGISQDFLFWTVLLNPLTPFFVVFCNVVATSNTDDFHLLQQITANLCRHKGRNSFVSNMHSLFSQFIDLCRATNDVHVQNNPHDLQRPSSAPCPANVSIQQQERPGGM
ncbi:hypothetical protein Asppvi_010209 [Aspergillus pseudoviridinutans]|uniref:Xylanolytic transcriptional activator regulatory domain-containing protein n=1 Tax=Aspergillus pseudoviridinutans TaxID=1517512 RepID=A0A9P3BNZ5_9EURO|nr:uncharacterized protein Asppvi_010209 [Aspergillus pseudoviridinutans]GIJ91244.1 hypothetical protein Asppvi_010209 [Aspergillus pseudoviridinutans]